MDSLRLPCHPRGPSKEWTAHPNLTEAADGSIHLQTVVVPVTVQTALSVQIYVTSCLYLFAFVAQRREISAKGPASAALTAQDHGIDPVLVA